MLSKLFLVLFVGLKLASVVAWSWFIVLIPLWIIILRDMSKTALKAGIKHNHEWAIGLVKWLNS